MPKQARAIATRETIVDAAAEVFAERSFASATLADVIARAGVTQGSLYFHFASKHELAAHLIREQHARSIALPAGVDGARAMIEVSLALARQIQSDRIVQAGLRLSTESLEQFPELVAHPYEAWAEASAALIERAIELGELAPDLDPAAAGRVLRSSFTGIQVASRVTADWVDLVDRLEELWRIVLPGLAAPGRLDELLALLPAVFGGADAGDAEVSGSGASAATG
ncbi:ScbR family autoregulator-binding transcription factor [Schumannella soli]|uniref:TetR/AcrR family transcriptional regulator n=1 Tax=Schumannella soli TaxID=2590779 RepID=A0A506Y8Q0_9MICO|nr:ScbR family autoregulator-binding transcription factor [Schumannella soli]TPW77870.1 TetR/AcrR family transcriptional regulator [Schumannella soli]